MRILGTLIAIFISILAQAQSLTYEGTLHDSSGSLIAESGVKLKAEVFDDALTCVLYEREYSLDLSTSDGHFTLDLATGTAPSGQPHTGNSLPQILSNANGNNVTCADSSVRNFTGTFVKRQIRISILEVNSIDIADIQLPAQDLELTPFANEAETAKLFTGSLSGDVTGTSGTTLVGKIQGVAVDNTAPTDGQILKYVSGSGKYIPSVIDSSAIADNSLSVNDVDFASSNGIDVPTLAAAPGTPSAGQIYYNSVDNKIYFYNGSGWIDTGAGGGDFLASGAVALTGNINLNGNYLSGDGGSEGVFVSATGAVGIGTGSPVTKLDVYDNASGTSYAAEIEQAGSQSYGLHIKAGTTGTSERALNIYDKSNVNSLMVVQGNGRIGIGTSSPAEQLHLNAGSDSRATMQLSANSGGANMLITMVDSNSTGETESDGLQIKTGGGANLLKLESTGNVGIGTAAPTLNDSGTGIHVHDSAGGASAIHLTNSDTGAAADDGAAIGVWNSFYPEDLMIWHYENEPIRFGTNDMERVIISAAGNVGVGTDSPAMPLDVNGAIRIAGSGSEPCTATEEGSQRYNSTSKKMEFCNGTTWGEIGSSSTPTFESTSVNGNYVTPPDNGAGGTSTATCGAGYTITGGGCQAVTDEIRVIDSYVSGNGWQCRGYQDGGSSLAKYRAVAICSRLQ